MYVCVYIYLRVCVQSKSRISHPCSLRIILYARDYRMNNTVYGIISAEKKNENEKLIVSEKKPLKLFVENPYIILMTLVLYFCCFKYRLNS